MKQVKNIEGNKLSQAICQDCNTPLISKKEHKEGYCKTCLITANITYLNFISKVKKKNRERLTENKLNETNTGEKLILVSPPFNSNSVIPRNNRD